jgi:hypothetical protein
MGSFSVAGKGIREGSTQQFADENEPDRAEDGRIATPTGGRCNFGPLCALCHTQRAHRLARLRTEVAESRNQVAPDSALEPCFLTQSMVARDFE